MKLKLHQFLIFLCCFFATEYSALAQFSDFPEPEWINEILFVNHHDKKLQELERKEAINDLRQSAGMQLGIVVNVKTKLKVKGASSPIELRPFFGRIQFVYKVDDNKLNPKDLVRLYEWKAEGRYRTILIGQLKRSGTTAGYGNPIGFRAQKYKSSSYLITIENLPPGEYGFSIGKDRGTLFQQFFCFCIRGGKDDLPKIEELPIFDEFFDDRYTRDITENAKIFVSITPGSKNFSEEICEALNIIQMKCVANFDEASFYLEYYYGKFAKFGPQGRCLQIRMIDAKTEKEILAVSRNVSGEGLAFGKQMSEYLNSLVKEIFN